MPPAQPAPAVHGGAGRPEPPPAQRGATTGLQDRPGPTRGSVTPSPAAPTVTDPLHHSHAVPGICQVSIAPTPLRGSWIWWCGSCPDAAEDVNCPDAAAASAAAATHLRSRSTTAPPRDVAPISVRPAAAIFAAALEAECLEVAVWRDACRLRAEQELPALVAAALAAGLIVPVAPAHRVTIAPPVLHGGR